MKKLFGALITLAILTACASQDNRLQSVEPTAVNRGIVLQTVESSAKSSINFFDMDSFDKKLSTALRNDLPEVTVTFPAPVTVNNVPERLDKWFVTVEEYDGTVELRADPDYPPTRGLITDVFNLVVGGAVGAYKAIVNKMLYGPVKNYNVIVYYVKGKGTITKVVFVRK